jgi:5-deoxy-glucuronate isomerase
MRRPPQGLAVKGQDKNVNTVGAGAGNKQGRNIFVHPRNSSMREISYGRIRLGGDHRQVSFANEGQETGLVCLQGECEVLAGANLSS